MAQNRFSIPALGYGLGLRHPHYEEVLKTRPRVDWFEILSENFMEGHPGYWEYLADLRAHYPLVMHGVSMNVGGTDALSANYLAGLKKLATTVNPACISDHLCWTGVDGINSHDLLPVPYTKEALHHIADRIKQVQDTMGQLFALENPSSYVEFNASTMPEWEFMANVAEKADCGVLLDVNNVYVSAFNHGFDAKRYIDAIPVNRIVYIHLAGHQHNGTHIIDTHDNHVVDDVWDLYHYTIASKGPLSTMIEWDGKIPAFSVLTAELDKARALADSATRKVAS